MSLLVVIVLTAFIVYATWAAFQNAHYTFGPYLSPFYSPELFGDSPHAWFGPKPALLPAWLPYSPALLILPIPGLFRLTCYYYRGAYYKAFWADPPACAVGEPRSSYWGEHSFPLILQNVHRYFLFLSLAVWAILGYDAWKALWFSDAVTGATTFGVGIGTIVLWANVVLLGLYLLGCHSLRHVVGGCKDEVSKSAIRDACYACATGLNRKHMVWAWFSLFSVAFADVYVRLCSMGIWNDWRIL